MNHVEFLGMTVGTIDLSTSTFRPEGWLWPDVPSGIGLIERAIAELDDETKADVAAEREALDRVWKATR
jgi:hypothetical protein